MSYLVQIMGTRAESLRAVVERQGCRVETIREPDELSEDADICLASGVHYIIERRFLDVPKRGIWGFHETKLPVGRGSAPLQWTVLEGIPELSVSFFEFAPKFDTGRLLGQLSAPIEKTAVLPELRMRRRLDSGQIQSLLHISSSSGANN